MSDYKMVLGFVWQFMKRQKWLFLTVLVLDCLSLPVETYLWPYIFHIIVDIFARYELDRMAAWDLLKGPIVWALTLVVYVETASRIMGWFMAKGVPKLQANLRMAMFDHIQHHSPGYFNERFAGSLANKITDMTTHVEAILHQLWWPVIPMIMTCVLGVVFLWFVSPIFAIILFIWSVIHLATCLIFARYSADYQHKHGEARSALLGKIVDSLTNNFAVNLFYRFRYEQKLVYPFQKDEERASAIANCYVEKMRCILSFVYFSVGIIGAFGTFIYLWLHGHITTGQAVQVFSSVWGFSMVLWAVGAAFPIVFQSVGILRQAYSVMEDPQDLRDNPNPKTLVVSQGSIVFDKVSFHYGEKELFRNKTVKIKGGEKIGLVGYTGSGKSTFVSLILRFFPLANGKITIDGQNIADVSLESLRQQIALIPQDPILFHRTLKENIAYGNPEASEDEILKAAKLAHCHEFISRLPNGYSTKVGERGTKLSGGEKQRIAIARAILTKAPILILDEATSSLDSITEQYIQESLDLLMKNRTSIVIAHRLSTLSSMDRILVFNKGAIIEEGSHNQLLAANGHYAKLWNMQIGGFLPENPE